MDFGVQKVLCIPKLYMFIYLILLRKQPGIYRILETCLSFCWPLTIELQCETKTIKQSVFYAPLIGLRFHANIGRL